MRTGENIFKRKDGRWEARYHKGRDVSGKLLYGFCYGKTYSEAKNKMEEAMRLPFGNPNIRKEKNNENFEYFCNSWILANKPRIRPSTFSKYRSILNNHIIPYFKNSRFEEIDSFAITELTQNLLYEKGLSPKTVKDILLVLHSVLKYIKRTKLEVEILPEIIYPKEPKANIRVLSNSEQKLLTRYLLNKPDRIKTGILLALWTGLRIGEICALKGGNIFPEEKVICVDSSMQRIKAENEARKTEVVIGPPKSSSSIRSVPITEKMLDIFEEFLPEEKGDFLLTGNTSYIEPRALQYYFKKCTNELGLSGVHFHTLRHSFATRCIESGMDAKTLSEILGHSGANITINRYVHCSMEMKRKNMEKLELLV